MQEMTIQQCFDDMEAIINKMEGQDISLEDSFELYQQGMEKLKICNDKINKVEKQVLALNETGQLEEFDEG